MWYVIESNIEMKIPEYALGREDVYKLAKKGKWETIGSFSNLSKAQRLYDSQDPRTWIEDKKLKARAYMITDDEDKKTAKIWSWDAIGE